MARKQTARVVEDHLHACCPRFPLVLRRTRPICCARAVHPNLRYPQIRVSHVGRRALGDDLGFVRGTAERSARAIGWGILGAFWERDG
jgi:hypothetical protein